MELFRARKIATASLKACKSGRGEMEGCLSSYSRIHPRRKVTEKSLEGRAALTLAEIVVGTGHGHCGDME